MEKRTLLAISLSLFILLAYNSMVSKSMPKKGSVLEPQVYDNKQVTENIRQPSPVEPIEQPLPSLPAADLKSFETDDFIIEFSNIGGTIKSIILKEFAQRLPITDLFVISEYADKPFVLDESDPGKVIYSHADRMRRITKTYFLPKNSNLFTLRIDVENLVSQSSPEKNYIKNFVIVIPKEYVDKHYAHDRNLLEYSISTGMDITRKDNAFNFSPKNNLEYPGQAEWYGFRDRYFCFIVKPEFKTEAQKIQYIDKERLAVGNIVELPSSSSENASYRYSIYFGPQNGEALKIYSMGFEKIVSFSNWGWLDAIAKFILMLLNAIHRILPSWGVSIILISIVIYLAMYPLTLNSMRSMKRMQALQPEMSKLREQYKNNPQRLNKEIMGLYKENKVNPFGGCLPVVFQMPIFVSLYQVLWRAVAFKGSKFLWIKDLSEPDRLFILPYNLPFLGNEVNILPFVMGVVMFFHQKMSTNNLI